MDIFKKAFQWVMRDHFPEVFVGLIFAIIVLYGTFWAGKQQAAPANQGVQLIRLRIDDNRLYHMQRQQVEVGMHAWAEGDTLELADELSRKIIWRGSKQDFLDAIVDTIWIP